MLIANDRTGSYPFSNSGRNFSSSGLSLGSANWLGGALDLAGDITTGIINYNIADKTNQANAQAVANTNKTNQAINENTNANNLLMNRENIAYQVMENQIAREREDNAVQRRVADLMNSGLSKTLAAGSPASANAMQAPQNTFNHEGWTAKAYEKKLWQMQNLSLDFGIADAIYKNKQLEVANRELDIKQQNADTEALRAAHDYELGQREVDISQEKVELQREGVNIDYLTYLDNHEAKQYENAYKSAYTEYIGILGDEKGKRLALDTVESGIRCQLYLSELNLNNEQINYVRKNTSYLAQLTANAIAEELNLKADWTYKLQRNIEQIYNFGIARSQSNKTTDSVPSDSALSEAEKNRLHDLKIQHLKTGTSIGTSAIAALGAIIVSAIRQSGGRGGSMGDPMNYVSDLDPTSFIR